MKLRNGKNLLLTEKEPLQEVEYGESPLLPTARRIHARTVAQDLVPSQPEPPQPTTAMQNYRDNMVFRDNSRRAFFNGLVKNQERIRRAMYGDNR